MADISGHMPGNFSATGSVQAGQPRSVSANQAPAGNTAVLANTSLADSAEELSFALAEKRPKSMAERKSDKSDQARLAWIQKIQQYLEQAPDLQKQHKLVDFVSANLGRSQTTESFIQSLKSFSQDESLQYLAGQVLVEASDPQDKEHYENALSGFKARNAKTILAGLNTSHVFFLMPYR